MRFVQRLGMVSASPAPKKLLVCRRPPLAIQDRQIIPVLLHGTDVILTRPLPDILSLHRDAPGQPLRAPEDEQAAVSTGLHSTW